MEHSGVSSIYPVHTILRSHIEEKSHKCNQCNYVSFFFTHLRTRMNTQVDHNESLPNTNSLTPWISEWREVFWCNQCKYSPSPFTHLRKHMNTQMDHNATSANGLHHLRTNMECMSQLLTPVLHSPNHIFNNYNGSAYCTKPVLCNRSLLHKTLSFSYSCFHKLP